MGFNPVVEVAELSGLRKPFTPTLGLAIAPLDSPHFEGSGGIFLRLSNDENDKRIALLTCAHVIRPPPLFANEAYSHESDSQPREDIVLLGTGAFQQAIDNIQEFVSDQKGAIASWKLALSQLPAAATTKRDTFTALIVAAEGNIKEALALHADVTKGFTELNSRVFGFASESYKVEPSPVDQFWIDLGFVQLYDEKIESTTFNGNKLFVGTSPSPSFILSIHSCFIQEGTRRKPTGRNICIPKLKMMMVPARLKVCCSVSGAMPPKPSCTVRKTWTTTVHALSLPSKTEVAPEPLLDE